MRCDMYKETAVVSTHILLFLLKFLHWLNLYHLSSGMKRGKAGIRNIEHRSFVRSADGFCL